MKDSIPVHVLDCLQQLVDVVFHSRLRQVVRSPLDGFIQVHFHELKDESKSTCRFITMRRMLVRNPLFMGEISAKIDLSLELAPITY